MNNRFFDINRNIHLNSIYIFILLLESDGPKNIEDLMLGTYLLKYPEQILRVSSKINTKIDENLFESYQIKNIQSSISKYSSKVNVDGFYEAIHYLYSKNMIDYEIDNKSVERTRLYDSVDITSISIKTIKVARYINAIIQEYGQDNIIKYL